MIRLLTLLTALLIARPVIVMTEENSAETPAAPSAPDQGGKQLREVDSKSLMQGDQENVIRHGELAYRLTLTRSGKLTLRK